MKHRILRWHPIHKNLAANNQFLKRYHKHFRQPWIKYPKWSFPEEDDLLNENDSIIYLAYSTKTKLTYIGETQNLKYRIETELRNAKNSANTSNKKRSPFMYFEKRMGHIGYETWNYVILANLGRLSNNQRQIRQRYEQFFIKKKQPKLNIKYTKNKKRKHGQIHSNKQLIKFRKKHKQNGNSPTSHNITTYEITELYKSPTTTFTVQCIDTILPRLIHGHHYKMVMTQRGYRLTNWEFVMNHIGSSQVIPNKRAYTLEMLRANLEKNKIKEVVWICNKMNHLKNNLHKFVAQLAKANYTKREIEYTNKNDLLLIWGKIISIPDISKKQKALYKIKRSVMSTFGTRLPYPCITFPYCKQLNLYRIRSLCFALTTNTFDHDIANYLNNSLQYIPKNLRSIKKILTNTKKINNLAHFQCAGKPWCHNNQHFSKDLKDMGKEFTVVGTINANYVAHPTRTSSVYPVLQKWAKFLLIYKYGLSNYNETLNKRFEDNYVNIYSKQSI